MSEMMKLAEIVEGLTDFETPEATAINNALHDLLPEPKCVQPPNYLRSLDAAMQLVPDGYVWTMHTFPDKSSCFLMKGDYKMIRPENQFQATPALALCAAALKARAHLEGE